ncbi:ribonucleoside-diphosphate reductase subunit alpha [bacterium]|nr:ribonucleoside-diphosphate reductase subunit alpha [bacterium]
MIKKVIKSDGSVEDFDILKLKKWGDWADVIGVNHQEIILKVFNNLEKEECTSSELHEAFIKECLEKNDEKHLRLAGRLYLGTVYKRVFGSHRNIPELPEFYYDMVKLGYWEDMGYSEDELEYIGDNIIDHDIDKTYTHTQIRQIADKYGIKSQDAYFETPQFTFIRMALACCKDNVNIEDKFKEVEDYYTAFAITQTINAPTPNYVNLGTPNKGYSSCCLIAAGDTAPSIATATYIADQMTCASAGIGHQLTSRSKSDPVKGGTITHKGKLPYYRCLQTAVKANVQSSRGGSATTFFTCNDPEAYDIIKARSVTTPHDRRIGGLDFSFGHVKEFRKRVALGTQWPLFSIHGNEELYEAMYNPDDSVFEKLLAEYELKTDNINYVNALDLLLAHLKEEYETGRAYEHNLGEMNRHTSFKDIIRQSNLCLEIVQPTKPYDNADRLYEKSESGEVSLCTLSSVIVSHLNFEIGDSGFTKGTIDSYYETCYLAAKMIDNIIDQMEYPFPQVEYTAKNRRNAAIGITGLAELMAKHRLKYSSKEGLNFIHMLSELHSYCVHKASLQLAKERGVAGWMNKSKYPDGWLPIDTYNKNVDTLGDFKLYMDWENLRSEMIEVGGLRFSANVGHPPCESSSLSSNSTNCVYPVRRLAINKGDSTKSVTFVAPKHDRDDYEYQLAWDIPVKKMLNVYGVIQKFTDQAISADSWVGKREDGTFSGDEAVENFLYAAWLGIKTKYYTNSSNNGVEMDDGACGGGGCKM